MKRFILMFIIISISFFLVGCTIRKTGEVYYSPSEEPSEAPPKPSQPPPAPSATPKPSLLPTLKCTNECTPGSKTCGRGPTSHTCGNYDTDPCLEWSSGTYCQYGCVSGECLQRKKCKSPKDCYDGNDCTEDICNNKKECENPNKDDGADCNPSPSSTPPPDSSPPPESGKEGFCEEGKCREKNCNNIYGPDYIECPKGSTDYAMCCSSDEKCCDLNKAADPVCCSNLKHRWVIEFADENCGEFSGEDDGEQVDINYCDPEKCLPPRSQKCETFWKAICCLPEPQEYCGVEAGGYNTPFCGVKSVCPKGTTFECYREVVWGKDNVLCCITGEESCETTPLGDKKFCRPYKCKSGETLCEGKKDYTWESKCCKSGEACFHQPNGRPKCEEI